MDRPSTFYSTVRTLVRSEFGINLSDKTDLYLDKKLRRVMSKTDIDQIRVASASRGARDELRSGVIRKLATAVTINETYFFREYQHLEAMVAEVLARRPTAGGRFVRILSLPCSTGEEPYSMAIALSERLPLAGASQVRIFGVDVDAAAIERAQNASYDRRAVSRLPASVTRKYFEYAAAVDRYNVRSDIRDTVKILQGNLFDLPHAVRALRFDIVFCRNLLIYFDDATKARAIRIIRDLVAPGGCAIFGHSETFPGLAEVFEPCRINGTTVYRRNR